MIKQLRIDEKLLNQVATTANAKAVGADRVLLVDNPSAENDIVRKSLLMQCPVDLRYDIRTLEDTIRLLSDKRADTLSILLVCKAAGTALKLAESLVVPEVNVAMQKKRKAKEKIELNDYWAAEKEDLEIYDKLYEITNGNVFNQPLPTFKKEDYKMLLKQSGAGCD